MWNTHFARIKGAKLRPFSIKIFVPSGDPEGVRVLSPDDLRGKGRQ
jgi:hypothetical protein